MKDTINVLIAEDSRNAQKGMEEALRANPRVNLLPTARDGLKALEALKQYDVDLLLLDIVLTETDGLGVLREMQKMSKKPTVVLVTALSSALLINSAAKLGAVHTLLKPADPNYIAERAIEVYDDVSAQMIEINGHSLYSSDVQRMIVEALHSIGMPPQLLGYEYMREAIILALGDGRKLHGITTVLYPEIAKKYDSTPQKVERSIRHAIETTWARSSEDFLESVFGKNKRGKNNRPSNSAFIATMTDYIISKVA